MSRNKKEPRGVSCVAYTAAKSGALNAQSFELTIKDGRVVEIKEVSRAPDRPVTILSNLVDRLWSAYRNQRAEALSGAANEE